MLLGIQGRLLRKLSFRAHLNEKNSLFQEKLRHVISQKFGPFSIFSAKICSEFGPSLSDPAIFYWSPLSLAQNFKIFGKMLVRYCTITFLQKTSILLLTDAHLDLFNFLNLPPIVFLFLRTCTKNLS